MPISLAFLWEVVPLPIWIAGGLVLTVWLLGFRS